MKTNDDVELLKSYKLNDNKTAFKILYDKYFLKLCSATTWYYIKHFSNQIVLEKGDIDSIVYLNFVKIVNDYDLSKKRNYNFDQALFMINRSLFKSLCIKQLNKKHGYNMLKDVDQDKLINNVKTDQIIDLNYQKKIDNEIILDSIKNLITDLILDSANLNVKILALHFCGFKQKTIAEKLGIKTQFVLSTLTCFRKKAFNRAKKCLNTEQLQYIQNNCFLF